MKNAIMAVVGAVGAVASAASTAYCIKNGAVDEVKEFFHKDKAAELPIPEDEAVASPFEPVETPMQ